MDEEDVIQSSSADSQEQPQPQLAEFTAEKEHEARHGGQKSKHF